MADFNFIRYANCWEDANLLLDALDITNKTGLSVLSGGDNTLAMLLKNPQKIVAFDINETQIHLFNLKKTGIKYLCYDDFVSLLGVYNTSKSYKIFQTLKDKMEPTSFQFFSEHPDYFRKGIINIGKFEHYFQLFKRFIIPTFATKKQIQKLANFQNVTKQKAYYETVINNRRLNAIFNIFFGFRVMGKFGRDKSFYDHVESKKNSGQKFREHFDYGITHIVNYNNPYINYILTNHFSEHCLPLYLQKQNFDIIKQRIDRVEIKNTDLVGITGKYDFFNLSDIFEYLDDQAYKENYVKLRAISKPNSQIAYYNMQGKRYLDSTHFELQEKLSKDCTEKMQAYFYNEFLLYKVRTK